MLKNAYHIGIPLFICKRSVRAIFRKGHNPCMLGGWGLRETQRS